MTLPLFLKNKSCLNKRITYIITLFFIWYFVVDCFFYYYLAAFWCEFFFYICKWKERFKNHPKFTNCVFIESMWIKEDIFHLLTNMPWICFSWYSINYQLRIKHIFYDSLHTMRGIFLCFFKPKKIKLRHSNLVTY